MRSAPRLAGVVLITAVTWAMNGLMMVMLAKAPHIGHIIGYGQGMGTMVITLLGTLLPAPPGFAGVYEAFSRAGLAFFGVNGDHSGAAMALTLVMHWYPVTLQAITAMIFIQTDGLSLTRLISSARDLLKAEVSHPS